MSVRKRVRVVVCSLTILGLCTVLGASLLIGCGEERTAQLPGKPASNNCDLNDPRCMAPGG